MTPAPTAFSAPPPGTTRRRRHFDLGDIGLAAFLVFVQMALVNLRQLGA